MGNVAVLWLRGRTECGERGERCARRSELERVFPSCIGERVRGDLDRGGEGLYYGCDGVIRRNAEYAEKGKRFNTEDTEEKRRTQRKTERDRSARWCRRLDAVFFGVVAEGAIGHFQGVGGAGPDSAGTFHGGQEEGALELLDVNFEIEAFGGKDGT